MRFESIFRCLPACGVSPPFPLPPISVSVCIFPVFPVSCLPLLFPSVPPLLFRFFPRSLSFHDDFSSSSFPPLLRAFLRIAAYSCLCRSTTITHRTFLLFLYLVHSLSRRVWPNLTSIKFHMQKQIIPHLWSKLRSKQTARRPTDLHIYNVLECIHTRTILLHLYL